MSVRFQGDAATLPLLAWQVVVIQVSESDRVIDPVLAFGRDHTVYFYQVVCAGPTEIRASGLQRFHLSYKLLNMAVGSCVPYYIYCVVLTVFYVSAPIYCILCSLCADNNSLCFSLSSYVSIEEEDKFFF